MIARFLFALACILSAQSASRAQNILILGDGGTEDSVYSVLSQAGFNVTRGGPYWLYTGVGIEQYRLVVFLNGVTYSAVMPDSTQWKIRNYVSRGGGLLTTEWLIWSGAIFDTLASILPVRYGGSWGVGSEMYRKGASNAITQSLPDSFVVPNDWSFSLTERDTILSKQAVTVFSGSRSGAAVVAGRYGNGKVVHWNMGGHYYGADNWSTEVKTLLKNIASYTQGVSSVDTDESVPLRFDLRQNYPNPFNPATLVSYEIPGVRGQGSGAQNVKLVVYDLLGREVKTLVNDYNEPGRYTVRFDASGLSSGVYVYRLTAGQFVESRKMVLTK